MRRMFATGVVMAGVAIGALPAQAAGPSPAAAAIDRASSALSGPQPPPPAPNPLHDVELGVVEQAGVGSNTAYARAGVIELGGGLSWTAGQTVRTFALKPQVGYFLLDNFELSALVHWTMHGSRSESFAALIEPSGHLPLSDVLFVFAGVGVGASYQHEHRTGLALAPRLGLNVLMGRSGLLTPALSYTASTNASGRTGDGRRSFATSGMVDLNVGYSIMW